MSIEFRSAVFAVVVALLPGCTTDAALAPQQAGAAAGCEAAIAYSTADKGLSVLALKDGKVVCENYTNGGGANKGHEIWSGTKSFTGVMAAIAVKDGMLTLDEKVADTITEWKSDPQKSQVTIRQLLSLSSGIGNLGQPGGRAPSYAAAIATDFTAAPGEKFQYGPQSFQVFGELIQRKLKARGVALDSRGFVKTRILDPLGMVWTDWRRTPEGDAIMAQGSSFTAREWIKFGEFIRKGGVTESGEQLVDPKAFRELFVGTKANPAYGVSFWLPRPTPAPDVLTASIDLTRHSAELPQDMVVAGGAGNQRMYVVPSCELTVVRQAEFDPMSAPAGGGRGPRTWSDFAFINAMLSAYCD
ncbi:MAG: serine hydrolase [Hyphomonadaceae bacterium]|nr:serine hydrolase [Hyphomonadaceae bacterium]